MSEVRESIALEVPEDRAERCILHFFERYRAPDGTISIPLQVDLGEFGVPGGLRLARAVTVHVQKRRDAQNLNDEIAIRWEPGDGGPFPSLNASLIAWSETPDRTLVELRGTYEPPLGVAGRLFDDAVGHRIAQHTARAFLSTLAEGAEACFHQ